MKTGPRQFPPVRPEVFDPEKCGRPMMVQEVAGGKEAETTEVSAEVPQGGMGHEVGIEGEVFESQ